MRGTEAIGGLMEARAGEEEVVGGQGLSTGAGGVGGVLPGTAAARVTASTDTAPYPAGCSAQQGCLEGQRASAGGTGFCRGSAGALAPLLSAAGTHCQHPPGDLLQLQLRLLLWVSCLPLPPTLESHTQRKGRDTLALVLLNGEAEARRGNLASTGHLPSLSLVSSAAERAQNCDRGHPDDGGG